MVGGLWGRLDKIKYDAIWIVLWRGIAALFTLRIVGFLSFVFYQFKGELSIDLGLPTTSVRLKTHFELKFKLIWC